jgi:Glycosyl transferase family 90
VAASDIPWQARKDVAAPWQVPLPLTSGKWPIHLHLILVSDYRTVAGLPCEPGAINHPECPKLVDVRLIFLILVDACSAKRIGRSFVTRSLPDLERAVSTQAIDYPWRIWGNIQLRITVLSFSQSVVVMAPPRYTTWKMEEVLEPWVHYVPRCHCVDFFNVEAMVKWVLNNEEAAQRIATPVSLFVYDPVYHPEAASDDAWIRRELIDRCPSNFHQREEQSLETERLVE